MTGPLLGPADLAVRGESVLVLDATVELAAARHDGDHTSVSGLAGWQEAHIPGSRHADLLNLLSDPAAGYHFAAPEPAVLAAALSALGVRDGVPVVTYDRNGGMWAARLWWLLDWLGVEAYVLDGGFAAWQSSGLPVSSDSADSARPAAPSASARSEAVPRAGGRLTARVRDGRWIGKSDIQAWLEGEVEATLVCALNPEAYAGEVPTRYSRRGHIPGSGNLPARSLVGADGRFLPEAELRAALGGLADDPDPVWIYCGGGISATVVALALTVAGRPDVAIYDGSLEEWSADPALPLELGRPA
ncbi:3-mercaptopyruvate sulfurtransferase SseA [Actinoplanes tereljensis]|uniref:Sulfurtransferase n=1 Tax=Paractinoplanes tereljensis TaxID=571912 RepID=A0A919NKT4_9ACTN|nr:rhodanese-like domain-containing protein [Actinoplanes tereljensis]GIF20590.1 sulfurtransferase [Actinoplanes tereljensis]